MTPGQRAKIRKAIKKQDADPSETESELNIVPFLDIVINLMLFLLATSAATMVLAETNTELPATCRGTGCHGQPSLSLSVTLTDERAILSSREGTIASLPRTPEGHDFAGLATHLAAVSEAHPAEDAVILSADPMVTYEQIIHAMDTIHTSFEDVRLSAGVR